MQWNDELVLIGAGNNLVTDDEGFYLPQKEVRRTIFADRRSIGMSEFYKARQSGDRVEMKFKVYAEEYQNEKFAEYKGKRYKILRTYDTGKDDFMELTLTDISTRGEEG